MKLLSIPLWVLVLAAMPLTAAAFDLGPEQPLVAANAAAPQLPRLDAAAPTAPMAKPDVPDVNSAPVVPASPMPRPRAPSSSRVDKSAHAEKPVPPPNQPSWQSLLPGSIQ